MMIVSKAVMIIIMIMMMMIIIMIMMMMMSRDSNYTIQNKLRTNCSQTCQRQSFELNDLKILI